MKILFNNVDGETITQGRATSIRHAAGELLHINKQINGEWTIIVGRQLMLPKMLKRIEVNERAGDMGKILIDGVFGVFGVKIHYVEARLPFLHLERRNHSGIDMYVTHNLMKSGWPAQIIFEASND